VFRTAKKPAGLQICTVDKTFRDHEVPPAPPYFGRSRQHATRDPGYTRSEEKPGSRVCTAA